MRTKARRPRAIASPNSRPQDGRGRRIGWMQRLRERVCAHPGGLVLLDRPPGCQGARNALRKLVRRVSATVAPRTTMSGAVTPVFPAPSSARGFVPGARTAARAAAPPAEVAFALPGASRVTARSDPRNRSCDLEDLAERSGGPGGGGVAAARSGSFGTQVMLEPQVHWADFRAPRTDRYEEGSLGGEGSPGSMVVMSSAHGGRNGV